MLWWNKPGNILSDMIYYDGKLFSEIKEKCPFEIRVNKEWISYTERDLNVFINQNYNNIVKIDTVFIHNNNKIYL